MADQRSVMKEYRLLQEKRQAGALTAQEEARFAQLRDLVGPDAGAGATTRPGFDVNAAAARLRESLLPAGLRNRPPSIPEPPPPPPAPEPEPTAEAAGLADVWAAAPFAPLTEPASGLSEETLFDPGTLGTDAPAAAPAWDAESQPYDPNAQAYDPNAPQQWDESAQGWDPNAQPYDPNAQPYDPNAPQQWDAGAQAWDPNAQPYDPNAQPYDPNAPQQWDPNAQPYDPNAPQQWDAAAAQGWDPNAQPYDPNAQPYDPNAPQQWDPNAAAQWEQAVQPAWDPNLAQPWGEPQVAETPAESPVTEWAEPAAEPAGELAPEGAAAVVPPESPEGEWSASQAEPEPAPAMEQQPWETEPEVPAAEPAAWDASALSPEAPAEAEPFDAGAPAFGEEPAGEAEVDVGAPPTFEPAPGPQLVEPEQPFGEPEPALDVPVDAPVDGALELGAGGEELLPFDAGAASAIGGGSLPEGWGAEPPAMEFDAPESAFDAAAEGDLAGPEQPSQVETLSSEEAQGLLAPLAAGQELTSDDDAFAQGFQLESNGSFGSAAPPTSPAWTEPLTAPEPEAWESAPAIDPGSLAPGGEVPPLDLAPIAPEERTDSLGLAPAPLDSLDEIEVEEIPAEPIVSEPPTPQPALSAAPPPPPPPRAPPPPLAAAAPPPPAPAPAADVRVDGTHRVVVHTLEGLVKRGVITDVRLDADALPLAAQADAAPERIATGKVKAIFFMLAAGEKAPAAEGKKVRVTFSDGRQIAGFSPDYTDVGPGFFMIPADTRTNTGRIWVYRSAVKSVAIS